MSFSVRVEGVRFSAGHFATYGGDCEPLHGHSYEVAAVVEGGLTQDSWVADFSGLKAMLRDICGPLDHRFLLQAKSSVLQIDSSRTGWTVRTPGGLEYVFPERDVVALPIDNSTAERLAEHLSAQLWAALERNGHKSVECITLEVWEGPGQSASYVRTAGRPPVKAHGSGVEGRLPLH